MKASEKSYIYGLLWIIIASVDKEDWSSVAASIIAVGYIIVSIYRGRKEKTSHAHL